MEDSKKQWELPVLEVFGDVSTLTQMPAKHCGSGDGFGLQIGPNTCGDSSFIP